MPNIADQLGKREDFNFNLPRPGSPPIDYSFMHAFTQESVYNRLRHNDRRLLHQQVGEVLERLLADKTGGDIPLTLAYHFEQAQDRPRALKYLRQAAIHAADTFANHEANLLFKRALAQLESTEYALRWDILGQEEQVLDRLGERREQANRLTQMQALAEILGDAHRLATTHNRRAIYFDKIGEYQAAAEAAEVGERIARRTGDNHLQAQSLNLLAQAAWRRADYREVQRWAQQALDALNTSNNPAEQITGLLHLGQAGYRLGQFDVALRHLHAAQKLTQTAGSPTDKAISHMILGWIYQHLGDYALAETHFWAKYNIRHASSDHYGEAKALNHLGWLAYDQAKPEAGLAYCQQALEIAHTIHNREHQSYALSGLGLNHELLGNFSQAAQNFQAALAIHTEIGATIPVMFDYAGLARLALAQNNRATAKEYITVVCDWIVAGNAQKYWNPWSIYLSSYQVLTALEHTGAADAILTEAHTMLHQRANEIGDNHLRHCFLTQVKVNYALEQAWNSRGAPQ